MHRSARKLADVIEWAFFLSSNSCTARLKKSKWRSAIRMEEPVNRRPVSSTSIMGKVVQQPRYALFKISSNLPELIVGTQNF